MLPSLTTKLGGNVDVEVRRGHGEVAARSAPGDQRQLVRLYEDRPLVTESGRTLAPVDVAYETWGRLAPRRDNAVLLLHALTGDSHAAGPAGPGHPTPGWWDDLVGPGRAIDTDRYFVVCPNVLGGCRGTTGPASPGPDGTTYGSRFPVLTVRDQVAVEVALADHLGIDVWHAVIGGSMGGMRALEWAVGVPDRVARAVVLAVGAAATAEQIALSSAQILAIRQDPRFRGGDYYAAPPGEGPDAGLGLARWIGVVSYRTELELESRFGRRAQSVDDPRFAVESYLGSHADRLVGRFDANSYVTLSLAMNGHDVGRGRGGVARALARVEADVTVVSVDTDRLYPPRLQHEMCRLLGARAQAATVHSIRGHDAFLLETEQLDPILSAALGAYDLAAVAP